VPLLFRITLTCPYVRLFKKRDVTASRYGQNISSRSSSRKLGQVDDQGMRMGLILSGIHVITGKRVRRRRKGEWQQTRQRYDKSPTFKFARFGLVC